MRAELRVEDLARKAGVSVDTIRFYQQRGLLPAPRRQGRVALYGPDHVAVLERIRSLQRKGLTLATIKRIIIGDLDAADEALITAVAGAGSGTTDAGDELMTLAEVADASGIPLPLLEAVAREGLLVARNHRGEERYTRADIAVAHAGLRLLEAGLPLPEILALARDHHTAMRAVAERAVDLFDAHVRRPLRTSSSALDEAEAAQRLVDTFNTLLPATIDIVTHHFRRLLLAVAQEHIEAVGAPAELEAVAQEAARIS